MNKANRSTFFHRAASWWERDETRLSAIRTLAYGLFFTSVGLTIYAGYVGTLPVWAFTVYIAFVVQLTYLTFMYAIKRSGDEDVFRALFSLRKNHLHGWRLEREMLAEFARFAFCTANQVDPAAIADSSGQRAKFRKPPWPKIDPTAEVCRYVREDLQAIIDGQSAGTGPERELGTLTMDFIAYSSETFLEMSRRICAEIEEIVGTLEGRSLPARVNVRLLVRDTQESAEWLIPLANDAESDRRYAAELRTRFNNVRRTVCSEFREALKDLASSRNVDFRVRSYRVEPLLKGVIVGRRRGVFGLYGIDNLKEPAGQDYSGQAVTLCACDAQGDFVFSTAANFLMRGFDDIWNNDQISRAIDG
jgi:hypothetical protein